MALKCELIVSSNTPHLQQLYTGFSMLHKSGIIKLEQTIKPIIKEGNSTLYNDDYLIVIINNKTLFYDIHDSDEIDLDNLSSCDFYFKRSYSQNKINTLKKYQSKIFPLGLNYEVLPNHVDYFAIKRNWFFCKSIDRLKHTIKTLDAHNILHFSEREKYLQNLPEPELPPKIIFMTRTWNPYDKIRKDSKVKERVEINDMRAACINELRREFKDDFFGGFMHTSYAKENYPEALLEHNYFSKKSNYIDMLRHYPICISTTGLHSSIGWKFAEYVAFSKAIITEKLNFETTGSLSVGSNYLEFSDLNSCLEAAHSLFTDKDLRSLLMKNNALYYHKHLKPDQLILQTILHAL